MKFCLILATKITHLHIGFYYITLRTRDVILLTRNS